MILNKIHVGHGLTVFLPKTYVLISMLYLSCLIVPLVPTARSYASGNSNPEIISSGPQVSNATSVGNPSEISADGRYVAYVSTDFSVGQDVLNLYDRSTKTNQIVFAQIHNGIGDYQLAADGSHIVFSTAAVLDSRATNAGPQIYEINTSSISSPVLISVSPDGVPYGAGLPGLSVSNFAISNDGSNVVWAGTSVSGQDFSICVTQASTGTSTCPINHANRLYPTFGSGRYIFYTDMQNSSSRYDLLTGVSQPFQSTLGAISPDGQYIASFEGVGGVLSSFTRTNIDTGVVTQFPINPVGAAIYKLGVPPMHLVLSGDNNTLIFSTRLEGIYLIGSGELAPEVLAYNYTTNNLEPVSINSWGNYANIDAVSGQYGTLSYDGSLATFASFDSNLSSSRAEYRIYVNGTDGSTNGMVDTTRPVVSSLSPSQINKGANDTATINVTATDDNSGVAAGEFYITDNNAVSPASIIMHPHPHTMILASAIIHSAQIKTAAVRSVVIGFPGQVYPGAGTPLTINPDATFTGTLGNDVPTGDYTVWSRVQDVAGNWSDFATAQLTVGSTAPTISSIGSASTSMRQPLDFTVTTSGGPVSAITEVGALPTGISFVDNGDGTANINGSAASGSAGTYPITITADNGSGTLATQNFTLTVTSATSAPSFSSANNDTETFGGPFSFTINTYGYPAPRLTKTGALPSGVTFVDNGDGTATLSGTPAQSAVGTYTLILKAKSTAGTATQTFTLNITKAPTINKIPNPTAHVGTAFSLKVTSKGYTTPALIESGTLPSGISFVDNGNGIGYLTGTPAVGSGGSYSITVTATNALGTTSQTFTLKVHEGPAIISVASADATVGTTLSFQVSTTGFPAPVVTKSGALPNGVTFHAATDTFSGIPKPGSAGTYPITITAKNSTGTATQNFVLVVH